MLYRYVYLLPLKPGAGALGGRGQGSAGPASTDAGGDSMAHVAEAAEVAVAATAAVTVGVAMVGVAVVVEGLAAAGSVAAAREAAAREAGVKVEAAEVTVVEMEEEEDGAVGDVTAAQINALLAPLVGGRRDYAALGDPLYIHPKETDSRGRSVAEG